MDCAVTLCNTILINRVIRAYKYIYLIPNFALIAFGIASL